MKKTILFLVLTSASFFSHASVFDPAILCFKEASSYYGLRLSNEDAAFLCSGATSNAPIDCYKSTRPLSGLVMKGRSPLILCQGARTKRPNECAKSALSFGSDLRLNDREAAILCREGQAPPDLN